MYKNKILVTIGLIIFMDSIGAGMVVPLLPTLFMNNSIGLAMTYSIKVKSFYFGLSYMLFPLVAIFSNPYLGYLSDYKGRKFVMTAGMIGFIITDLLTVISIIEHSLWLFLVTRLMSGGFCGSYTAASAALIDISSNEQEKMKNIKFITLISILGFILSPLFSILIPKELTSISLTIPFIAVFLISILNLFLIVLFFPKNNNRIVKSNPKKIFTILRTSLFFVCKEPQTIWLSLVFFLFQLGYNFYFQILALYLQQKHNFSISQTGLFFFVMGICYMCGMYIVHPFLVRRFSSKLVTNTSIFLSCFIIGILGISGLHHFSINYIFILLLSNILLFIAFPIISVSLSKQFIDFAKNNEGLIMGAIAQITSLALIISGILISFHTYFGGFELLFTSFILLVSFIFRMKNH